MDKKYIFETRMAVRDYECDIEGIVNNANYLHYCEHTRHLFLKQCGLSFAEMHEKGVDAVVARMSMQFKTPLRPDLYRESDEKLCFRAQVELVCIVNGRLSGSEDYDRAFAPYIRTATLS